MLLISIHALLRELKQCIKNLKRIEIKVISLNVNIQIRSCNGTVITAANSNRIKRKEC
jgi:hypothetical protein